MRNRILVLLVGLAALVGCGKQEPPAAPATPAASVAATPPAPPPEDKVLNIFNWSDYIAEDTIANFEKETGIKVTYDVFDSNEVLEAKLLAGDTGYDLVVPSLQFLGRQVQAGVFHPLEKAKLKNYGNLDASMMAKIAQQDPNNDHALPYLWGTTGIGYNVAKIKKAFGNTDITASWDVFFKPENLKKLKACGVTILDTPSELVPIALNYLGEDPNSHDPAKIDKAAALLQSIRPYITNFHSSSYIDALAAGDICLVVGWSGDVIMARDRATEAKNGVEIAYSIPKEGAPMWFDMIAIPKSAKHKGNATLFLDYLLRPEVMAGVSNFVSYPNANTPSKALINPEITSDPTIYPPDDVLAKLFTFAIVPPDVDRQFTRIWTELKTGK